MKTVEDIFEKLKSSQIEYDPTDSYSINKYQNRIYDAIIQEKIFKIPVFGWGWVDIDHDCGNPSSVRGDSFTPDNLYDGDIHPLSTWYNPTPDKTLEQYLKENHINNKENDEYPEEYIFDYNVNIIEIVPSYSKSLDKIYEIEKKLLELNLWKKYVKILHDTELSNKVNQDLQYYNFVLLNVSKEEKVRAIIKTIT